MYHFLKRALEVLRQQSTDLKTVTAEQLMYIKEDLILEENT